MSSRKPSPALVISIISLIVALSGTAVAASHLLITNSSQVKNRTLRGIDLHKGTITGTEIKRGSLSASLFSGGVSGSSVDPSGLVPMEVHRITGPEEPDGGTALIASLDLPAGAYLVLAKTNVTPENSDPNLLAVLSKENKTVIADCKLDIGGQVDGSAGSVQSFGTQNPVALQMQMTRTLGEPGKATLTCHADALPWHASDASIIAVPVSSVTRSEIAP
jgi:hypothetical protein